MSLSYWCLVVEIYHFFDSDIKRWEMLWHNFINSYYVFEGIQYTLTGYWVGVSA